MDAMAAELEQSFLLLERERGTAQQLREQINAAGADQGRFHYGWVPRFCFVRGLTSSVSVALAVWRSDHFPFRVISLIFLLYLLHFLFFPVAALCVLVS
jgi:hypothetical protein